MPTNEINDRLNAGDLKSFDAVMAIIQNDQGEYLVLGHSKFVEEGFKAHTFPVGKVDKGDTIEGTLTKEMSEELGIEILSSVKVDEYDKQLMRNGKLIDTKLHTFKVTQYSYGDRRP